MGKRDYLILLGLSSTLVLGGTLHMIALATSGITAFSHSLSNALRSADDFVHCMVMVLARGVNSGKGTIGWRAKALGWKEEI
jgi:hypothetical protein